MSNKTQLATNNEQLASLIQELANKAQGGGAVELVTGVFTATSEMGDEPGVYNVTLTSDTLAASSRMFIAILLDDSNNKPIINFLYRFSQTDDWKNAMGGNYALAGIAVNDTTISGKGDLHSHYTYNYIAG